MMFLAPWGSGSASTVFALSSLLRLISAKMISYVCAGLRVVIICQVVKCISKLHEAGSILKARICLEGVWLIRTKTSCQRSGTKFLLRRKGNLVPTLPSLTVAIRALDTPKRVRGSLCSEPDLPESGDQTAPWWDSQKHSSRWGKR